MTATAAALPYSGFLPATKLGLSGKQKNAAIWTLRMLEEHQINGGNRRFDMGVIVSPLNRQKPECGTAACLAGWMNIKILINNDLKKLSDRNVQSAVENMLETMVYNPKITKDQRRELSRLFYGHSKDRQGEPFLTQRTIEEAVATLRQFLTTGSGFWPQRPDCIPERRS